MLKQTVVYFDIFVSSKHSTQCLRGTKIPEVSEYTRRHCLGGKGPKFFPLKSRNCVCTVILLMWNMPILTNVQIKDYVDMVTK